MATTDQQAEALLRKLEVLQLEMRSLRESLSKHWVDGMEITLPLPALVVFIGGMRFALRVEQVRVVSPMVLVSHLQGAPERVRGVFGFQGHLVPLIDIVVESNTGPRTLTPQLYIVVLKTAERTLAVVVDEIDDVHVFQEQQLVSHANTAAFAPMVRAIFNQDNQPVHLLEPALVLAASELNMLDEIMHGRNSSDAPGEVNG